MPESHLLQFNVQRFSADGETAPEWQSYPVHVEPGMTVLDGLLQIRTQLDATLVWRFSCRMGVCGSCGMVINGRPGLACSTQILDVSDSEIRLRPLSNFAVVRDLVVDLSPMLQKHAAVRPYIVRERDDPTGPPTVEQVQTEDELIEYLQFAGCIKCGVCMAACPTLAMDERFLGPMPLSAVYRYNADSRDAGSPQRKAAMSAHHGISHCHYAAECSRVCPKGVDPGRAIQRLKHDLIFGRLFKKRRHRPSGPRGQSSSEEAPEGAPPAPPPSCA